MTQSVVEVNLTNHNEIFSEIKFPQLLVNILLNEAYFLKPKLQIALGKYYSEVILHRQSA